MSFRAAYSVLLTLEAPGGRVVQSLTVQVWAVNPVVACRMALDEYRGMTHAVATPLAAGVTVSPPGERVSQ